MSLIDEIIRRNRDTIRQSLYKIAAVAEEVENEKCDESLEYFENLATNIKLDDKLITRGGIGIRKSEGVAGYETYVKQRVKEQIINGEYEKIYSGFGRKIALANATLFTNSTQTWDWIGGDEKTDDQVKEIIQAHRTVGGYQIAASNADYIASAVDSGCQFYSWANGHLTYQAFSPSCLRAKFHGQVYDGDQLRGVNYTDLNDAAVVVIQLSSKRGHGKPDENQYLAIFGRNNKEYPLGRYVIYNARDWRDWPAYETAMDWRTNSGEVANPLSYLASQGFSCPEYPITITRGGLAMTSDRLTPVSTTLYEINLEIDVAISRALRYGLKSAHGTKIIKGDGGAPLPSCTDGIVALHDGQEMTYMTISAGEAETSLRITKDVARLSAEGFGVPGYQIIADDNNAPEAGIAIMLKTRSLIETRDRRIELNKQSVSQGWDIERALYHVYTGKPLCSDEVRQIWNPGRVLTPEDPTVKAARLKAAQDGKAIDYVRYVRDMNNLPDDVAAIDWIRTMNGVEEDDTSMSPSERRIKYNALGPQQQQQRPALPGGLAPRLQRQR